MAALECAVRNVTGDPKATLGKLLNDYPDLIPKPLDAAIEKAWGFASNRGRHITEGSPPERADAELVVGLAAVLSTYLATRKV